MQASESASQTSHGRPGTYYAFLPVRDCRDSIGDVLQSLLAQTIPPEYITVVDDGSTDGTQDILSKFEKQVDMVRIIRTGNKTRDYSRLASLWNRCISPGYDYHLICAGDIILDADYAERIVTVMDGDQTIAVASGNCYPKPATDPHGGGRFVRQSFFYEFYEKYPEIIGYESEILFRARIEGYVTKVLNDVKFTHTDPLGGSHDFVEFGPSMRTLGYHPLYALARSIYTKSPKLLWRYATFRPAKSGYHSMFPKEFRDEVRRMQSYVIKKKMRNVLRKGRS